MGNHVSSPDEQCAASTGQGRDAVKRREDEALSTDSSDGDSTMIGSHPTSPLVLSNSVHHKNGLGHLGQLQQLRSLRESLTETMVRTSRSFRDRCWKNSSDGQFDERCPGGLHTTGNSNMQSIPNGVGASGYYENTNAKTPSNPTNVNVSLTMSLRPNAGKSAGQPYLPSQEQSMIMPVRQDPSAMNYYNHATAKTHPYDNKTNHHSKHEPVFPPRRSKSVPVKCPRGRTSQFFHSGNSAQGVVSPDGDDAQFLTRLYDNRTWELYRRITESRRKSGYNSSATHNSAPLANGAAFEKSLAGHNIPDWELDGLHSASPPSGQEMIFMFDFD